MLKGAIAYADEEEDFFWIMLDKASRLANMMFREFQFLPQNTD